MGVAFVVCVEEKCPSICKCLLAKFCAFAISGFQGLWSEDAYTCGINNNLNGSKVFNV